MRLILIGFLALITVACQQVKVQRVEPAQAPVAFSTYAWGQSPLGNVPDASAQLVELDDEMRAAVRAELAARGYREVEDSSRADMLVDYQVAIVDEQFVNDDTHPSWDAQFDANAQSGVVDMPNRSGAPRVTLTLGIGRADGPAIWGGSASKLLARPEDAKSRQSLLAAAVRELLKDLPPAY
ncbi:DUF4136 domain-containing protein [Microbulbifer sp. SAOS-129_SWC]|uniref:DUF4136 domain-containing protein n=1 Tax=Microbulbifer sp. SAOS-129_SWC TaxID=3145235 RepID=UPI003216CE19